MAAKILIVEDELHFERLILQRFRKKIRTGEYHFIFANNGVQALEKLRESEDIHVVLSDINMPHMDGLTLIAKLKEKKIKAKIVIVSAYGDMPNIRKAMNLGAYDFVTKPIDFDDLETTISRALNELEVIRSAEKMRLELNHLQQELTVASGIQQSILPKNFSLFPFGSPFELYAKMVPAKEVGGDFYDFFFIDDDHLGMVIGDVSGKGMPAALFMAVSRTLLKATALKDRSPGHCLQQVNFLLCQDNAANLFVTVFYMVLNIHNGKLNYCSAGHNPPWIIYPDGKTQYLDNNQHPALGIEEHIAYHTREMVLSSGAVMLLYTDGITEAMNEEGHFFSEDRLENYLRDKSEISPKEIIDGVYQEVKLFTRGAIQSDDITMLAIKKKK